MTKSIILTFWALIGFFVLIVSQLFIPVVRELFRGSLIFLLPFIIFSLLGITLIFLTFKQKIRGSLKKFLILTGISATGFFVFVFLHNIFYGLGAITNQLSILKFFLEILQVVFFIIAIFVCPVGFLIGFIGTMIVFIKKKKEDSVF